MATVEAITPGWYLARHHSADMGWRGRKDGGENWLREWLEDSPHGRRFMRHVAETPRDYSRELEAEKDEGLRAGDAEAFVPEGVAPFASTLP